MSSPNRIPALGANSASPMSHVEAHQDLTDIATRCAGRDWDGEDADPVSTDVIERARRLLVALPAWCPTPDLSADSHGAITLEWEHPARNHFAISLGKFSGFAIAWTGEGVRCTGVAEEGGDCPPALLALLQATLGVRITS